MLTDAQIDQLADALDLHSNEGTLSLIATDLGVNWENLTTGVTSFRGGAVRLIRHLNAKLPPRDAELLEMVRTGKHSNAALRAVASALMTPNYFSPNGDPHEAIVLGRTAFIARPGLRLSIRDFTTVSAFTSRMMVVRGDAPGGKSYTWEYLRHLAFATTGAQPLRLRLKGKGEKFEPRHLFQEVFSLLDIEGSTLLPDDPQLSRLDALLARFKGKLIGLTRRCWLVIDDLNDATVLPPVREAAFAIAHAVEELKSDKLWVALLGYNPSIVDPELRHIVKDDAEYPSQTEIALHLQALSNASAKPLGPNRTDALVALLFQKYPQLDKAAMIELTDDVEHIGEKLRSGVHP